MVLPLRLVSVATGGSPSAVSSSSFSSAAAPLLSLLLLLSVLLSGEAYVVRWNNSALYLPKELPRLLGPAVDGYSLAAAKDGSRGTTTTTAPPIVAEGHHSPHRGHSDSGRGGHGVQHHGHGHVVDGQQPLKPHHQHQHEDGTHNPMPDFERQLALLKEDPGSSVESGKQNSRPIHDEDMPIEPQSRKDGLFTPGMGVEEVSFLGPIRRPGEDDDEKNDDDLSEARPLDVPLQPDLLESEADVLEELKKLSAVHDILGPSHLEPPTRPPFKVEEPSGMGIGGATEDHIDKSEEEEEPDEEDSGDKNGEERGETEEDEDESNDEDEESEEEEDESVTEDPAKEVASLEERLSVSLRKLAERRKQAQKVKGAADVKVSASTGYRTHSAPGRTDMSYPPSGTSSGYYAMGSGPGTAPETASGSAPGTAPSASGDSSPGAYPGVPRTYPIGGDLTSSAPISSPELLPSYDANEEKGEEGTRTVMKKAHMARKLMDSEDPKKDEDLLELMLRIAENPDEWKRVHHLLRQLDDDLTTYEKTMHRVETLALEKSSGRGEGKKGRKKQPGEEKEGEEVTDAEQRRQEMSQFGLPAGTHGENLSSTTQHPLQPSDATTSAVTHHGSHKDWPRFAYHRVTTAPHPYFLQQQQQQKMQEGQAAAQATHHRNAYIAVSVITPPKGRHGGMGRPLPSPPPVYAVSPTPEGLYQRPPTVDGITDARPPQPRLMVHVGGKEISEETIREPMEEEVVENVAKAASRGRHHKAHGDPIEDQLRTLADVEAKLRHHLREKERMRHILQEAGKGDNVDEHSRSKRSAERSTGIRQHRPNGLILLKTS